MSLPASQPLKFSFDMPTKKDRSKFQSRENLFSDKLKNMQKRIDQKYSTAKEQPTPALSSQQDESVEEPEVRIDILDETIVEGSDNQNEAKKLLFDTVDYDDLKKPVLFSSIEHDNDTIPTDQQETIDPSHQVSYEQTYPSIEAQAITLESPVK